MRRKGERTKRQVERDFPFFAEIPIPVGGLGTRLEAMHRWCWQRVGHDGYGTKKKT